MSPPTEKGEETRQRILNAAIIAFSEGGFDGTSLNELIRETGLTKGGFYFHFASKDALASAVFVEAKRRNEQDLLEDIGSDIPAIERLAGVIRAAFGESGTDHNVQAMCRLGADRALATRLGLVRPHARWAQITQHLFDEAKADGDVPQELDTHAAAYLSVAAYFGLEDALGRGTPEFLAMCEPFIAFTFRGAGVRSATAIS
jgi:AcrR family transcriptional regulator